MSRLVTESLRGADSLIRSGSSETGCCSEFGEDCRVVGLRSGGAVMIDAIHVFIRTLFDVARFVFERELHFEIWRIAA